MDRLPPELDPTADTATPKTNMRPVTLNLQTYFDRTSLSGHPHCQSNTADKLRGAHGVAHVHDDRADHDARTRLQPPLVSFIDEMDSSPDSIGIDVPESVLVKARRSPSMENNTLVAVDIAKEIFEVGVSDRPGRVVLRKRLRGPPSSSSSPSCLARRW